MVWTRTAWSIAAYIAAGALCACTQPVGDMAAGQKTGEAESNQGSVQTCRSVVRDETSGYVSSWTYQSWKCGDVLDYGPDESDQEWTEALAKCTELRNSCDRCEGAASGEPICSYNLECAEDWDEARTTIRDQGLVSSSEVLGLRRCTGEVVIAAHFCVTPSNRYIYRTIQHVGGHVRRVYFDARTGHRIANVNDCLVGGDRIE